MTRSHALRGNAYRFIARNKRNNSEFKAIYPIHVDMQIGINGKIFEYDESVNWDDAISEGGDLFKRARLLGIPLPMALIVTRHCFTGALADLRRAERQRYDTFLKEASNLT